MRFLFRPIAPYASYLKRSCLAIAESMSGRGRAVVRRIIDGFIVQVEKDSGEKFVSTVIDVDGVFFVNSKGDFYITDGVNSINYHNVGSLGCIIFVEKKQDGERIDVNPTHILMSNDEFDSLELSLKEVCKGGIITLVNDKIPLVGPIATTHIGSINREITLCTVDTALLRNPSLGTVTSTTITPAIKTDGNCFFGSNSTDWDFNAAITSVSVPLSDVVKNYAFRNGSNWAEYQHISFSQMFTCKSKSGDYFVLQVAQVPDSQIPSAQYNENLGEIVVFKAVKEVEREKTVLKIQARHEITNNDLYPDDKPQGVDQVASGKNRDDYYSVSLVSVDDVSADGAQCTAHLAFSNEKYENCISFGYGSNPYLYMPYSHIDRKKTEFIQGSGYYASVKSYGIPCEANENGFIDVIFGVYTNRPAKTVKATWLFNGHGAEDAFTEQLDSYQEYIGGGIDRLNTYATYIARLYDDGNKSLRRIDSSTFTPILEQDKEYCQRKYKPVLLIDAKIEKKEDKEEEIIAREPIFVCICTESDRLLTVNEANGMKLNIDLPSDAAVAQMQDGSTSEQVSLKVVSFSGRNDLTIKTGAFYPVCYPTANGVVSEKYSIHIDGQARRSCYAHDHKRPEVGEIRYSTVAPVCLFDENHIAAIVASRSGFANDNQTAKIAVYSISSGDCIHEYSYPLPFSVKNEGREIIQWSITCVEIGEVDENSRIVRYPLLLITKAVHNGLSELYVSNGKDDLRKVGNFGSENEHYGRGPVYYLGTSIAPANIGKTTNRPFFKTGKPL